MKAAVIVFPGSNCDRDLAVALRGAGAEVAMVWHKDTSLPAGLDLVAVPGGFSFGDYLRCGAIAARSPVMRAVVRLRRAGRPRARRLQRLPGAARDRPPPRRAHAQRRPQVPLRPGAARRRHRRQRLHRRLSPRARPSPSRSRTTTATTSPTPPPSPASRARTASPSATPPTPTARPPTSPASSRRTAASSA